MNNVGVLALGSPNGIPVSAWQSILDINVLSIVRSNAVFLDDMVRRGSGHIVNTASTAGLFAYGYERLPYSASKGAVVALTEALALYAKPRGVGVTCLSGPVATNIVEQVQVFGEIGVVRGPPLRRSTPLSSAIRSSRRSRGARSSCPPTLRSTRSWSTGQRTQRASSTSRSRCCHEGRVHRFGEPGSAHGPTHR